MFACGPATEWKVPIVAARSKLSAMETDIIEGLSKLSNEDLSGVVSQINMGALLYNVRNRTHFFSATTNNKVSDKVALPAMSAVQNVSPK
jgi:hypothetical protein